MAAVIPAAEPPARGGPLALLFVVMLAIAAGNTALQSVLPAIGRTLGLPDMLVAAAFSLSALVWSVAAGLWAPHSARHGRRMVAIGMGGFILSLLLCGLALIAGLRGWITPGLAFTGFVGGRLIYGAFGAAAPPAAQAIVAGRSSRAERTRVLTLLASAFGLGTILGPALAPLLVLPFVGLAGSAFVFAGFGLVVLVAAVRRLPAAGGDWRGAAGNEPSLSGTAGAASAMAAAADGDRIVRWGDRRVVRWVIAGLVSGHAQAMIGQSMGFLIIDRLSAAPAEAQPLIGLVLMAGALATLLAQWGVIPLLGLEPPALVRWGAIAAAAGAGLLALAGDLHLIALGFALASLGFGFLRPGFSAGLSLAVAEDEQASVAGRVTTINGAAFVLAPAIGVGLYTLWSPAPFVLAAAALAVLAGLRR